MLNVEAYLRRIDYHGRLDLNAGTLRALHSAHMLAVSFENLDIFLGRPIVLDEAAFFDKIVRHRRGGFCYELNGLFAGLLRQLGFDVVLLSARVISNGAPGREFDHMTLLVQLEERWLADVGFGDSFREPLRLDEPGEQVQPWGAYRLVCDQADQWTMLERGEAGPWRPAYIFSLEPHSLSDFSPRCYWTQTSPESHFTRQRICSRATPDGRISVSDRQLIVTASGQRQERVLADETEYAAVLSQFFGIALKETRPVFNNP